MNSSHNKYQLWPQIWLLFGVCFVGFSALLMPSGGLQDLSKLYTYGFVPALAQRTLLPLVGIAVLSAAISFKLLYVVGGRDTTSHLSGPVRLEARKAAQDSRKKLYQEVRNDDLGKGVFLHPKVQISTRAELSNILVYGQQGSGKSVTIKPIVEQIRERGDRALIYDRKNEYTSLFLDRNSILINPNDIRSFQWDISQDVRTEQDALLVAQCLIEETPDPLWSEGARLLFTGMVVILLNRQGSCSWYSLAGMLDTGERELQAMLQTHYPKAAVFIQEQSKTTQGFLVTLIKNLHWISHLRAVWRRKAKNMFSVNAWLQATNSKKTLIVAHDDNIPDLSQKLCTTLFSLLVRNVLAMGDSETRKVWFVLDELSSIPKGEALEMWLRLGRSKGARTVAGLQAISQLRTIYGSDQTETILSLFGHVIALRVGAAGGAAKYASESFGHHEVERYIRSVTSKGEESSTQQISFEPLVRPEELVNLKYTSKGIHGFMMVGGRSTVYKLCWPFPKIEPVAESIVYQASLDGVNPRVRKSKNRLRRRSK
ncbi:type IV secretion system DNA-binding domain-containing protein [Vibrio fluvialis]|nr:type IV secretion system DNA-binding domain-containing protein [Vibrio fluvialis]